MGGLTRLSSPRAGGWCMRDAYLDRLIDLRAENERLSRENHWQNDEIARLSADRDALEDEGAASKERIQQLYASHQEKDEVVAALRDRYELLQTKYQLDIRAVIDAAGEA